MFPLPGDMESAVFGLLWQPSRASSRLGVVLQSRAGNKNKAVFWRNEVLVGGAHPTRVLLILSLAWAHVTYTNQGETLYEFPAGAEIAWVL